MAESVLYTVILVVYFTGLMALGLWFNGRNRSRQEYFLARGDLGPATLGFSYSATQMSGSSYMGAVGTERELGYNFAPAGVSSAAAAWFTYVLLGERLRRLASRIRYTTIVDVFEARYRGKGVSMTATLLMLLAFIPLIAAQLKAAIGGRCARRSCFRSPFRPSSTSARRRSSRGAGGVAGVAGGGESEDEAAAA